MLLSERHIREVHNTDASIVLEVETHDGEVLFVVTGRGAPAEPAAARQLVMSLVAKRRQASSPKAAA